MDTLRENEGSGERGGGLRLVRASSRSFRVCAEEGRKQARKEAAQKSCVYPHRYCDDVVVPRHDALQVLLNSVELLVAERQGSSPFTFATRLNKP